ncbi:NIPSNAP family protein [Shinella sp. WSJ-2]|uniref:NIPSNAP family protein n=1 Tax=Shinella sp. WSJ-2 TaxID=2303749 RepID=UPI000E3E9D9D|nr:NIPSNAP family protein [Shinella sp. WSJ-2]RFZ88111.1 NIPSNAP family protein [Shinella sp. WSJ-2]
MRNVPVTCEVRYRLDPERIADFHDYARIWTMLIERHGGTHHGYFMPRKKPEGAAVSFPDAGGEGAADIAVALFTFPDEATYLVYRDKVAEDAEGIAANARFLENPPFKSYERTFLQPLSGD